MTEKELAEIEARASKATEGPWIVCLGSGSHLCTGIHSDAVNSHGNSIFIADFLTDRALKFNTAPDDHRPDMRFCCEARTDIPALCKALREAWAEIEEYENYEKQYDEMLLRINSGEGKE
jgi:hypothetical protein